MHGLRVGAWGLMWRWRSEGRQSSELVRMQVSPLRCAPVEMKIEVGRKDVAVLQPEVLEGDGGDGSGVLFRGGVGELVEAALVAAADHV